jgi:uncharacterized protein with HEPN domain
MARDGIAEILLPPRLLARIQPALSEQVPNPKLAIDLRNRIIHGYVAADDEIVYLTV